jgi:protein-disulfide isomerase
VNVFRIAGAIVSIAAALCAQPAPPVTPAEREAFEAIIKDYLLNNPGVIREAIERLRAMEEADQARKVTEALERNRAALLEDPGSPVAGNPKGDVTVVEFFDYNCGYCKKVAGNLQKLAEKDPNVRIVYKEYPILGQESLEAARAALAVHRDGKKYLEFHQAMMESTGRGAEAIQAALAKAGAGSLATKADDAAITALIAKNHKLAADLEIQGTPAFIIGDKIIPGGVTLESLVILVNGERARQRELRAKGGRN